MFRARFGRCSPPALPRPPPWWARQSWRVGRFVAEPCGDWRGAYHLRYRRSLAERLYTLSGMGPPMQRPRQSLRQQLFLPQSLQRTCMQLRVWNLKRLHLLPCQGPPLFLQLCCQQLPCLWLVHLRLLRQILQLRALPRSLPV